MGGPTLLQRPAPGPDSWGWPSYILALGLGFLVLTVSGGTEILVYVIHRMCQGGSVKSVSVKYVYIHKFL